MMKVSDLKYITTKIGRQYELIHPPLGQGGQGVVFRCKENPELLFKFVVLNDEKLIERDAADPAAKKMVEALSRGLQEVKLLSLPDSCHVARPQEELHQYVGYSMRMLQDMVPISQLIALPGTPETELDSFYTSTGGLRRRLMLLHNLAKVFHDIHTRGICYGDISSANAYVSSDPAYHEAWLIDADNMRIRACDRIVYTPWYGAPEVVSGQRYPDMRSDSYSFALLAWYVLAQVHAFMGAALDKEDDDWDQDDWDAESPDDSGTPRELEVQRGEHPWIHDERSDANRTSHGIPVDVVCSPRLKKLFHQTFEEGRLDPSQRPSMAQWVDAFQRAVMCQVECTKCHRHYYPRAQCPWRQCEVSPMIHIESRLWLPEVDESVSAEKERSALEKAEVHARLVRELPENAHLILEPPLTGAQGGPRFELMYHANFIYIKNGTSTPLMLIKPDRRSIMLKEGERFKCERGEYFWLHCGELSEPHRHLTFHRI